MQSSSLWSQGPEWLTSETDWPKWSPMSVPNICTSEEIEARGGSRIYKRGGGGLTQGTNLLGRGV